MDTAWIQVFVLTLSECVAPAGKAVCQEREFDLQFLTRADCEVALQQLVALKAESEYVIVNRAKSGCAPSAREADVFENLEAVSAAADADDFQAPVEQAAPSATLKSHEARLEKLPSCEESQGEAPCKIGSIIVEAAAQEDSVDVWRRDRD